MRVILNDDGSSSVICETIESEPEDISVRAEVLGFAEDTFRRQRSDWMRVRLDAWNHPDPTYRERCQRAAIKGEPPSYADCLALSKSVRRKREIDHPDTIAA